MHEPNESILFYGHIWLQSQRCFKIGDRQTKNIRLNRARREIYTVLFGIDALPGVISHQGVSDSSDKAHPL